MGVILTLMTCGRTTNQIFVPLPSHVDPHDLVAGQISNHTMGVIATLMTCSRTSNHSVVVTATHTTCRAENCAVGKTESDQQQ